MMSKLEICVLERKEQCEPNKIVNKRSIMLRFHIRNDRVGPHMCLCTNLMKFRLLLWKQNHEGAIDASFLKVQCLQKEETVIIEAIVSNWY